MDQTSVRRAAITNLGCKVNQSEMDDVERLLRSRGVRMVDDFQPADLVVVNTCTVTSMADQKSRQAVRQARRSSPNATLLVTGCSVSIDPAKVAAADPAARLFDNESKAAMLAELDALLGPMEAGPLPTLSGIEPARAAHAPAVVVPADIDRKRAVIKIQDGCSFHCTYCIIPRARGPERSVPADQVLAEALRAVSAGHREVVLTGINAGTYGIAAAPPAATPPSARGMAAAPFGLGVVAAPPPATALNPNLAALVGRLLAETRVERIRLSSIEPQHVTDELLAVWAASDRRCQPHFHIPLQSGDDAILRRMGRRYDTAAYARVIGRVRRAIPGAAIHLDVITGFPGEDEASFERTASFLQALEPAGVHVFRYSARPGTPAARMIGRVDEPTVARRAAQLLSLAAGARALFATNLLGGELRVLFERPLADGRWLGHDEHHVDVVAASPDGRPLANAIGVVIAESIDPAAPDRMVGRVLAVD